MALSFALLFIATSLLVSQHVQGSGELDTSLTAPMCNTSQATAAMLACKANFLQSAGQNFTDDCEDGIVEEFMQCINSVQGCSNASAFLEKAFYDHYGCMDTTLRVQKRSFRCGYACRYRCGPGELNSFFPELFIFLILPQFAPAILVGIPVDECAGFIVDGSGSLVCHVKSGPGPFCQEKSGPGPVLLSKSKQVHFWQGKKVDPVQFCCQNPGRSTFGRGKKWTRSSFLPKSRQVHFWQGKKVDPVQFPAEIQAGPFLAGEKSGPGPVSCRNPGRSMFGRGKKWTRSSFAAEIQAGPILAGEKSGPGPVSCRNPGRSIFGRGKSGPGPVSLPKSRQVQFWQGKKVDLVQFPAEIQAGPILAGEKVDLVQFRCRNPGRSNFAKGKKWTRSSFAAEI